MNRIARLAGLVWGLQRLVLGLVMLCIFAAAKADGLFTKWESLPKEKKLIYANVALAGAVTAWGIAFWDYGDNSPFSESEGWFGRDTEEGGMDKLGHAYLSYIYTHGFAALYEHWGFEPEKAARYGAFSSLWLQTFMEIGDSLSRFGFSHEDAIMNVAGTGFGYLTWRYPELSRKLDFRVEITPEFNKTDFFTDYEQQKYLLAFKLDGFETLERTPLRYFELHLGYYARGYSEPPPTPRERNVYIGIGVNLSSFFRRHGWTKTATVLRYVQPPYTTLKLETDLNR
ncbi:MAG: YfiM family protein [Gammaproteobacteria bacterium]|nr:YfiM family protein [Gammaproteobacteria bacterium]